MRTFVLFCFMMTCVSVPQAQAQEFGRVGDIEAAGTSYHVFARPGEPTVQIQVVSPSGSGLYEVSADMDLGRLLTLTGGSPLQARSPNIKIDVTVRLYRQQGGQRAVIYEAPYEEMLEQPAQYPALQDEDVLIVDVEQSQRFTWQNALSIATSVGTLILLADSFFDFLPGGRR